MCRRSVRQQWAPWILSIWSECQEHGHTHAHTHTHTRQTETPGVPEGLLRGLCAPEPKPRSWQCRQLQWKLALGERRLCIGTALQPVVRGQLAIWSLEPISEASAQIFFLKHFTVN